MAVAAGGTPSEIQTGDTVHFAGGQSVDFLTGSFIKSVSANGLVTYQDSVGVEDTIQLALGGATITEGGAPPTGGSNGDIYLQILLNRLHAIWRRGVRNLGGV